MVNVFLLWSAQLLKLLTLDRVATSSPSNRNDVQWLPFLRSCWFCFVASFTPSLSPCYICRVWCTVMDILRDRVVLLSHLWWLKCVGKTRFSNAFKFKQQACFENARRRKLGHLFWNVRGRKENINTQVTDTWKLWWGTPPSHLR